MGVTQKQIAEHLGVSQALVAHALKDYPDVSKETKRRVAEVAERMGYGAHSNTAARALRARRDGSRERTHSIAILATDVAEGRPLHEVPFFGPLFGGLKAGAREREVDLSFFIDPHRLPRILAQGGADGVIGLYYGAISPELRQQVALPILRVGDGAAGEWALRPDDRRGIYLATQHLIQLGHRKIAYLGDLVASSPDQMYRERVEGYFQALRENGLLVRNELMETHAGDPYQTSGEAAMARLLGRTRDFTAVVCFADTSAMGAINELKRQGLRVPQDISVTGFDGVWVTGDEKPELTTVYFDRFEMGQRAIGAICDAADDYSPADGPRYPREHELLPVRLVPGTSTSKPKRS